MQKLLRSFIVENYESLRVNRDRREIEYRSFDQYSISPPKGPHKGENEYRLEKGYSIFPLVLKKLDAKMIAVKFNTVF